MKTMNRKFLGFGILLMTLMMSFLPLMAANAYPANDEWDKGVVEFWMKLRHKEIRELDSGNWTFTLGEVHGYGWYWYRDVTVNGTCEQYELEWEGRLKWSIYAQEWVYWYEDYYDFNLTKVGPGTTVPEPSMYYIKPGDSYKYTAVPSISDDIDYRFVFSYWRIDDGENITKVETETLEGTAEKDLNITAVFRTEIVHSCMVIYEDGLSMGYMWRDDHKVLAIKPKGSSTVIVTIDSDYGTYTRVFNVRVRSLVIYFKPYWFEGDYTLTVTCYNGAEIYYPDYMLAG